MFISPVIAIEHGWVKRADCNSIDDWKQKKLVSPNALDFTLDNVLYVDKSYQAVVGETKIKQMRPLHRVNVEHDDTWILNSNEVYDGTSLTYVEVPKDVAAILYTRSTFARNGVFIVSGLYDSGYKGQVGFTVYTIGGSIRIEKGTRVGQIAFIKAEAFNLYKGGWNHPQGTHYTENNSALKELEKTHKVDSLQISKPAGTVDFI